MAQYRCYLLDGSDKIVAVEDIEIDTGDAALAWARQLCAERRSHAFELWQGRERVFKEARGATPTATQNDLTASRLPLS
ncbi:MAG TPA: hypothetical protein VLV85_06790 [Stellaceae bacterium]|jgi:hypothetical protein|nr:hypothetical protein [Stellaceae bacterium]